MIILDQAPELILPAHYRDARPAIIRPGVNPDTFFPVQWDRKNRRAFVSELVKTGRIDRDDAVKIATAIPFGFFAPASGGPDATIVFKNAVTNANSNVTSFTNTHAGSVRTGKCIVVVTYRKSTAGTNTDPTAVTLAGTSLTKMHTASLCILARQAASIWISTTDVTTDGTDNVVITTATLNDKATSVLYEVNDLIAPGTTVDQIGVTGSSTPTLNNDASAGCVMIAVGINNVPTAFAWTGITEDYDATVGASAQRVSTASEAFATAGTKSISAVHGGTTDNGAMVVSVR